MRQTLLRYIPGTENLKHSCVLKNAKQISTGTVVHVIQRYFLGRPANDQIKYHYIMR